LHFQRLSEDYYSYGFISVCPAIFDESCIFLTCQRRVMLLVLSGAKGYELQLYITIASPPLFSSWWEPSALAEGSNASALRKEFDFDHAL